MTDPIQVLVVGRNAMTRRDWSRCAYCHAPWFGSFTKHKPVCPLFEDLIPKDNRISRKTLGEFLKKAADELEGHKTTKEEPHETS